MFRDAVISDDELYRYKLVRRWRSGRGWVTFVMLNPSTADAVTDDNTIRRCMGFAELWGYSALHVINLYAYRSTDPRGIGLLGDPVGPLNDKWIRLYSEFHWTHGYPLVAAWGNNAQRSRVDDVLKVMGRYSTQLRCLGMTSKGNPKHPLRLAKSTQLIPWGRDIIG